MTTALNPSTARTIVETRSGRRETSPRGRNGESVHALANRLMNAFARRSNNPAKNQIRASHSSCVHKLSAATAVAGKSDRIHTNPTTQIATREDAVIHNKTEFNSRRR